MWRMLWWPGVWWLHYGAGLAHAVARGPKAPRLRTPVLTLHVGALRLRADADGTPPTPRCRLYLVRDA